MEPDCLRPQRTHSELFWEVARSGSIWLAQPRRAISDMSNQSTQTMIPRKDLSTARQDSSRRKLER